MTEREILTLLDARANRWARTLQGIRLNRPHDERSMGYAEGCMMSAQATADLIRQERRTKQTPDTERKADA